MAVFSSLRTRLRKKVAQALEGDPSHQLVVGGRSWLCPYCAQVGVDKWPETPDDRVEAVLDHLLEAPCPNVHLGEGTTRPLAELKREAAVRELRRRVKKELGRSPAWQLMDLRRHWFCPFCAEATSTAIPADSKMTEEILQKITSHVDGCFAYARGKGEEKPLEQLKATVKTQNRSQKLGDEVRRKLEGDPVWRQKDPRGRWICPFCTKVMEHIDLSTHLLMFENAPGLIARHLLASCSPWQSGVEPRLLAKPAAPTPGSGPELARPGPADLAPARPGDARPRSAPSIPGLIAEVDEDSDLPLPDPRKAARPTAKPGPATGKGTQKLASDLWGRDGIKAEQVGGASPALPGAPGAPRRTLRELESSGEFHLIDDPEVKKLMAAPRRPSGPAHVIISSASGPSLPSALPSKRPTGPVPSAFSGLSDVAKPGPSPSSSGSRGAADEASVAEWRREIERDLAAVRSAALDGSGSLEDTEQAEARGAARAADGLPGFELRVLVRATAPPHGDFVEAIRLDSNRIGILLGGVAGEDKEGALVAAMARNLLRIHARTERDPAAVLRKVNAEIFSDLDARTFVSAAYAVVDGPRRQVAIARAGLTTPAVVSARRTPVLSPIESEGMVMGIDRGTIFDSTVATRVLELSPGDLLVLATNGAIECKNRQREELGVERFHAALRKYGTHEAEYLIAKLGQVFADFSKDTDPGADVCVLALKLAEAKA